MRRILAIAAILTAAPVLAQEQPVTIINAGSANAIRPTAYAHDHSQTASGMRLLLSSAGGGRYILAGTVPLVYRVLGLNDEQMKSVESLCKQAKNENMEIFKSMRQGGDRKTAEDRMKSYNERKEKQDALISRCEAKIAEALTKEQKELLEKITTLAGQKSEEDRKIIEQTRAAHQTVQEKYEKKLQEILTPEQLKLLGGAPETEHAGERH